MLALVMPLLTSYGWEESTIPVPRYAVTYTIVFYLGVYWVGYAANKRLDGRTWKALGWNFGLALLPLSVGVGLVVGRGEQADLLSLPKIPYLVVSAVVGSALLAVLIRFNNPVRFPPHAQHLNALKRGRFLGKAPSTAAGRGGVELD